MDNTLFLAIVPSSLIGVWEKIKLQRKTLSEHCDNFTFFCATRLRFIEYLKIAWLLFSSECVYLRWFGGQSSIIILLYRFLRIFRKSRIFLELPTPFASAIQEANMNSSLISKQVRRTVYNKFVRPIIFKNCEGIVTYVDEAQIWKHKQILISNGCEIPEMLSQNTEKNAIEMVFVGSANYWHGLDRIARSILSLSEIERRKFHVHVIGNGSAIDDLKSQVKDLGIQDVFTFYGTLVGDELYHLLSRMSIGIGTLAGHRKGMQDSSCLKSRLYVSHGIPYIASVRDNAIPFSYPFVYTALANDDLVDLIKIQAFIDDFRANNGKEKIHEFAKEKLSMDAVMQNVIHAIKRG